MMNLKKQLLLIVFLGCVQFVHAQEFLPQTYPDRVILTWAEDPKTTQTVTWRTSTEVTESFAEIVLADESPEFPKNATRLTAKTILNNDGAVQAHYHNITFTGLLPGKLYAYRVGHGELWTEWFHFRTAASEVEPFSFIYFGDAQNDVKSMWSRVIRQAFIDLPRAAFMLHAGDLINRSNSDKEWGEWHHAGGFIHAMIPSIATPGNHEYFRDEAGTLTVDHHWNATFNFPTNGPAGHEGTVFHTDYQDAKFISLNSQMINLDENSRMVQAEWLEDVLANNDKKWIIITFHHPIYSSKEGRDNPEFREVFKPIFDKYNVDLVLQGHDHTYGRGSNIPMGVNAQSEEATTMYVVSVSGPKMYDLTTDKWMDRAASNVQLYQLITIDGDELHFDAYTATGELYDSFQMIKKAGGKKQIVDKAINWPEKTTLPASYRERYTEEQKAAYNKIYSGGNK